MYIILYNIPNSNIALLQVFRPVLAVKLGTLKGAFHESKTLKYEKDKGEWSRCTICCAENTLKTKDCSNKYTRGFQG